MTVLVLNVGSSSIKCQLFTQPAGESLAKAAVERVGQPTARLTFTRPGAEPVVQEWPCPDHLTGIERILAALAEPVAGLPPLPPIEAVGHRVVHAGEAYTGSVPVTNDVLAALDACSDLAPLHNPPNLAGIRACRQALPDVPMVCVFDNALHHTLAPEVWLYGLPRSYYERDRIRRYGFHGVAFRSILGRVEALLEQPAAGLRVVSLMLGSGCTANAWDRGRSVAVSTGFTPLEGLVQSTRCGDLDPGIVLALLRAGWSPADLGDLFNRESGLKGLSGIGPDMRDIETCDDDRARLAIDVFVHRAVLYVGGYAADLGGLDVLAFGGGIGQNAAHIRERVCTPLEPLGVRLDPTRNATCVRGAEGIISAPESAIAVVVAAVDEERVIAEDTYHVVCAQRSGRTSV